MFVCCVRIPVIFEGDLAHAAVSHLKPNDVVHIAGQLSTDPPHLNGHAPAQSNFQVCVVCVYILHDLIAFLRRVMYEALDF